eukprot:CAMPEP_0198223976 /NCGR_PEP_ID=MMETSP1445-20131203/94852_1 /TAXON_ID=36898 /ORGANISM="Pyramimonas sp., Strain CCMP2087" /LENGTH=240 /DNA_ID=CAMNT_0043902985 /DNA_START=111 /DNA_END=830 /DNA_ORIENTATION=+
MKSGESWADTPEPEQMEELPQRSSRNRSSRQVRAVPVNPGDTWDYSSNVEEFQQHGGGGRGGGRRGGSNRNAERGGPGKDWYLHDDRYGGDAPQRVVREVTGEQDPASAGLANDWRDARHMTVGNEGGPPRSRGGRGNRRGAQAEQAVDGEEAAAPPPRRVTISHGFASALNTANVSRGAPASVQAGNPVHKDFTPSRGPKNPKGKNTTAPSAATDSDNIVVTVSPAGRQVQQQGGAEEA